jgi:hypothetical protein
LGQLKINVKEIDKKSNHKNKMILSSVKKISIRFSHWVNRASPYTTIIGPSFS